MERWDEFDGGIRRARRFAFDFPLQYRATGADEWRPGHGRNISRSGLLFHTDDPSTHLTRIEVTFDAPVRLPGQPAAAVVCHGRVVRRVALSDEGEIIVAATIETYRFQRPR